MKSLFFSMLALFPSLLLAATDQTKIHQYMLDNGLQLIVKEDHRAPVVFSSIWYKVDGSYEPRGITGISHALEHMMFRGTAQYGPGKLAELVNAAGGEQNAMTDQDYTVYFQTLPADQLALSLQLESDRMHNLILDQDTFTKEIQVVMEERRMRTEDNPQALTLERFNAIAFINNPYQHPVVGWMSDLQQMTIEDLRNWYHQWYVPNNAVIILVGDIQPEAALALVKQNFASLAAVKIPVLKPTAEVSALGVRHLTTNLPAQLPWIVFGYNTPSLTVDRQSEEPYVLTVLTYLLGGGDSSRLSRDLVRGKQLAASASADYNIYNLYSNLLTITATPAKSISMSDLQKGLQDEINQLQNQLVSKEELQRVKTLLIANHVYEQDSLFAQAFNLGLPEVTGLSWRQEAEFIPHIETVTAEQIQAVAKKYLIPAKLTIGILQPVVKANAPITQGEPHANVSIVH